MLRTLFCFIVAPVAFVASLFLVTVAAVPGNASAQPVAAADLPELPAGSPALDDPFDKSDPATFVTSENLIDYKSIIAPEFYSLLRSFAFELRTYRRLGYTWRFDDQWEEWSRDGGERSLPQLRLGKQYELLRSRGFYFGSASMLAGEADTAELGRKLLWNAQSALWSLGSISSPVALEWQLPDGSQRTVTGTYTRIYPKVMDSGDQTDQLFRELVVLDKPAFLKGLSWLSFRFLPEEEDLYWMYSTVLKQVRQLTGSNRSDNLLSSPVSLDDFFGWSGKADLVMPEVERSLVGLVGFPALQTAQFVKSEEGECYTAPDDLELSKESLFSGKTMHSQPTSLSAKAAILRDIAWVPRKLWRVDLAPKDPYSLYGRQVLYIDAAMMLPVMKVVFDRVGQRLKTVIAVFGMAADAERQWTAPYPVLNIVAEDKTEKVGIVRFSKPKFCRTYHEHLQRVDFDPAKLGTVADSAKKNTRTE